jgi:hypothetical protein
MKNDVQRFKRSTRLIIYKVNQADSVAHPTVGVSLLAIRECQLIMISRSMLIASKLTPTGVCNRGIKKSPSLIQQTGTKGREFNAFASKLACI